MNVRQKNYIFIVSVICSVVVGYTYFLHKQKEYLAITSYDDCVTSGYEVTTTFPETCSMPGKKFFNPRQKASPPQTSLVVPMSKNDFENMTYVLEGENVTFKNGVGEILSDPLLKRSTTTLTVTGAPLLFDINEDTATDTVVLLKTLAKDPGTMPSYYITASVSLHTGYTGVNMIYLGDDVASPSLVYKNGGIHLTYTSIRTKKEEMRDFIFDASLLKERR